jgi:hypothetical protein
MRHELWVDRNGLDMVCLAGSHGDDARAMLDQPAQLFWTFDAESHFEAMTRYYEFRGLGTYTTDFPDLDRISYRERGWE